MQIKIAKNRGMALLSLVILTMLFIVFLAGLCYLIYKVVRWTEKLTPGNGGSIVELQSSESLDESAPLPPGAIVVPVVSTNAGTVLRFTVEQSTNLTDWIPLTNFLCAPDEFWQEWKIPVRTDEPQRFFKIGAEQP